MKIPTKLKIGNRWFEIMPLQEDGKDDYYGRSLITEQYIKINSDLLPDAKAETFLHEILHIIFQQMKLSEIEKEEKIVHPLACALYQVLKDNKLLK